MRLSFKKRKEKKTDSSGETAQAYRNMHPMVRCVKTWTELNWYPTRWLPVLTQRHSDGILKTLRARQRVKKEYSKTGQFSTGFNNSQKRNNRMIYSSNRNWEKGKPTDLLPQMWERGSQPWGSVCSLHQQTLQRSGPDCTPGYSRAWHPGVRFRCGLCSVDTWRNDHLPWEKHGGISSQQQRFMTIHSFPASK